MQASAAIRVRAVGAASALGFGASALWDGLAAGRRALSGTPLAGRIDRGHAREQLAKKRPSFAQATRGFESVLAGLALADALERAGLEPTALAGERTAVVVGSTKGA